MSDERLARLHEVCDPMPGVAEGITVHHPSFKVGGKAFVMVTGDEGDPTLWMKSDRGTQAELVAADPERYFVPPYVGHHGWVGVRTGAGVDWAEVQELVVDAFRAAATKRAVKEYDAAQAGRSR